MKRAAAVAAAAVTRREEVNRVVGKRDRPSHPQPQALAEKGQKVTELQVCNQQTTRRPGQGWVQERHGTAVTFRAGGWPQQRRGYSLTSSMRGKASIASVSEHHDHPSAGMKATAEQWTSPSASVPTGRMGWSLVSASSVTLSSGMSSSPCRALARRPASMWQWYVVVCCHRQAGRLS